MAESVKSKEGFVYILINPSFKGMVKIGLTSSGVEERVKQLSRNTNMPTEFITVYDELVSDCRSVEKILHDKFQEFRTNPKREFFKIPTKEAIKALQQVAAGFTISEEEFQYSKSFIDDLRFKFGRYVKSDIVSARIVQTNGVCFFETCRRPYPHSKDEIMHRTDLHFIWTGDSETFSTIRSANENASILQLKWIQRIF